MRHMLVVSQLVAQVVEQTLWDGKVVGSKPGRAIPKVLKMLPVATMSCAWHLRARVGFSSLTHAAQGTAHN